MLFNLIFGDALSCKNYKTEEATLFISFQQNSQFITYLLTYASITTVIISFPNCILKALNNSHGIRCLTYFLYSYYLLASLDGPGIAHFPFHTIYSLQTNQLNKCCAFHKKLIQIVLINVGLIERLVLSITFILNLESFAFHRWKMEGK